MEAEWRGERERRRRKGTMSKRPLESKAEAAPAEKKQCVPIKRVALVIGNTSHTLLNGEPLKTPSCKVEADTMGAKLRELGYKLVGSTVSGVNFNVTRKAFKALVQEFMAEIDAHQGHTFAIFYLTGISDDEQREALSSDGLEMSIQEDVIDWYSRGKRKCTSTLGVIVDAGVISKKLDAAKGCFVIRPDVTNGACVFVNMMTKHMNTTDEVFTIVRKLNHQASGRGPAYTELIKYNEQFPAVTF
jgi:hypothetical protein